MIRFSFSYLTHPGLDAGARRRLLFYFDSGWKNNLCVVPNSEEGDFILAQQCGGFIANRSGRGLQRIDFHWKGTVCSHWHFLHWDNRKDGVSRSHFLSAWDQCIWHKSAQRRGEDRAAEKRGWINVTLFSRLVGKKKLLGWLCSSWKEASRENRKQSGSFLIQ